MTLTISGILRKLGSAWYSSLLKLIVGGLTSVVGSFLLSLTPVLDRVLGQEFSISRMVFLMAMVVGVFASSLVTYGLLAGGIKRLKADAEKDPITSPHALRPDLVDRKLREAMARAVKENKPLSVMLAVIDDFALVTENKRSAGNLLLEQFAAFLRGTVNGTDLVLRYRVDGDEFLVIQPRTGVKGAGIAAEKLRLMVFNRETKFHIGSLKATKFVPLTMSAGVTELIRDPPDKSEELETLKRRLDEALTVARAEKNVTFPA